MRATWIVGCVVAIIFLAAAHRSAAQTAPAHAWVDVNFDSVRSAQDAQHYTFSRTQFFETARAQTLYPALPSVKGAQLGGGFRAHSMVGFGVAFDAVNYQSQVGLGVSVPHPTIFNRMGTGADVTEDPLQRKDRSIDLSAMLFPRTSDAWQIRIFGGPTYFRVTQEMVETVGYSQFFNVITGANIVAVTGFTKRTVEGNSWGVNGGVDVGYFFSRNVGIGGVLRVNRGTVKVDKEPLTNAAAELKVGHSTFGGGLRLRF